MTDASILRVSQKKRPPQRVLPGFGLTLGLSVTYLSLLILLPLASLVFFSMRLSFADFWHIVLDRRVLAAFRVSFASAALAATIDAFFGLIIAWVLARYSFFGKRLVDALIDLPFAIPTAVTGIALATLFSSNGLVGGQLAAFSTAFNARFGTEISLEVAFSSAGIVIALMFIGIPFIVRTVQPVLEELDRESEEAATSLGARFHHIFARVIFPAILPALLTGFALAFARGLGEYGSVIFISSNAPYETEIVPLLIVMKLGEFNYEGASAIGVSMLLCSFLLLLLINLLQTFARRRRA
ncbi:MAG: sulfate ABC transporter permease subunit CysT [Zoogloeaceae bacterium]|jgi:sulfate transport system permease protein|nr:sulfate ABC transporter permease subunit CysT [Zoogloeaceae bacterium]